MYFSVRKIIADSVTQLVERPIHSIKPFSLMYAPVYLYLKKNQKYVSIKAPLDFFAPDELSKLSSHESVFILPFIESLKPFQEEAERLRKLITFNNEIQWTFGSGEAVHLEISPVPFELSNEILKTIGPLWWKSEKNGIGIEPFYTVVFVDYLCDPFPNESLLKARENGVDFLEMGILVSSWLVFLALHLGYSDLDFLNYLRRSSFAFKAFNHPIVTANGELDELIQAAEVSLQDHWSQKGVHFIQAEFFSTKKGRVFKKLGDRLARVREEFVSQGTPPSIYGDKGFIRE